MPETTNSPDAPDPHEAPDVPGTPPHSRGLRLVRLLLGGAGVLTALAGVRLLVVDTPSGTVFPVATWLAGAVALHDLLLAPLVLLAALALRGPLAGRGRGALRAGLLVAWALTLVALPVLLRPGAPRNATALPLDYPRNWALLVAAVLLVTVAAWWWRSSRKGRPDAVH
jgi:hypothetical protein